MITLALSAYGRVQYQDQPTRPQEGGHGRVARRQPRSDAKHHDDEREEKTQIVEVFAEDGDHVEPPPPELVEPDPELTEKKPSKSARTTC